MTACDRCQKTNKQTPIAQASVSVNGFSGNTASFGPYDLCEAIREFHETYGAWGTAKHLLGYIAGILFVVVLRSNRVKYAREGSEVTISLRVTLPTDATPAV